jgi:glycine cleavage system aminomethyltransferase T
MFCPTAKVFAANAFVEPGVGKIGTALAVAIRGKPAPATVVKRPLYIPAYRR